MTEGGEEAAGDPMRIVIVAPPWYPVPPPAYGGIESLVDDVVAGLVGRGHDVTLIGPGGSQSTARLVQTYDEPQPELIGHELQSVVHAAEALEAVRSMRPDVVHDNTQSFGLGAASLDCPVLLTVHGPADGEPGRYLAAVGRHVGLVSISYAQRLSAPDLPWFATVYNGLHVDQFTLSRDRGDHAVFLGRMSPDKGAAEAIDVARAAGRRLLLAGKCREPEELAYFEAEIEPRLGPGIEWLGELDKEGRQKLLGDAGCFLFPLQWEEPFGLVVVEALACGTPVLTLARGAVAEIMVDSVTGFVRKSPEQLVPLFDRLAEIDPEECRRHVEENFAIEHTVLGYERAFRDAIAAGGRGR